MSPWISDLLFPIILAAFTALLGYITWLLKESKKINDANAKGTMLLLRREIIDAHERYCTRGDTMTAFDYQDITEIHDAYKELGGNGLTDKMFNALQEVEIGE